MAAFIAPIAQAGLPTVFNLFRLGHADDAVDLEEDRILSQFLAPVAAKAAGISQVTVSWVETDRVISSIDPSKSPLSPQEALAFIQQGDQIEEKACAAFGQQGFPCGGKPGYAGGAGRDIPRTWGLLRAKLTAIRGNAVPLGGNIGSSIASFLGLGGKTSNGATVQAGFLSNNVVLIGAALLAAWLISYNLSQRD